MKKNKIKNLSYFCKRLRDNGFIIWKIFDKYNVGDTRAWTILVNPGMESIFITCYVNDEYLDYQPSFTFNDDGSRYRNNIKIKTASMEIIINNLIENGVEPNSTLYKKDFV